MSALLHALFAHGLFTSPTVHTAVIVGALAAISASVAGVFTVMRGQSFAGHALGDLSAAGGSAAFLLGISPLAGFIGVGAIAAGAMSACGSPLRRARDVSTGVVFGAGLGLAGLLLYLDTTRSSTTGAAVSLMFGSMFAVAPSTLPEVVAATCFVVLCVAALYRPLLLASTSSELASVQGVRVALVEAGFLGVLVVAVALSALTVGAILATALLIGPAATATRLAKRPATAIVVAVAIGVGSIWVAIVLAYDSYYWSSSHSGWPVSFFVVSAIFVAYVLEELLSGVRARRAKYRGLGVMKAVP
jgi:zinc/manganese transport system permease protein